MNHEFDAISRLFRQRVPFQHPFTQLANGDDASVHQVCDSYELVVSTDTAVSGVHWPEDMSLQVAGQRAVCAALSDLAAMGAEAAWLWLAVMAADAAALKTMSDGIVRACLDYKVELAGGDTVSSPTNAITVTVAGIVPHGLAMTRAGAKVDEEIWLIGSLGLAALGLSQWQSLQKKRGQQEGTFLSDFQNIQPQLQQGVQLRQLGVRCCIDVSDGLLQDAAHIALASQVSLHLELSKLQGLPSFHKLQSAVSRTQALQLTLNGGEDYGLLFTAPKRLHQQLLALGAQAIGVCAVGHDVQLVEQGNAIPFTARGYDHFAK